MYSIYLDMTWKDTSGDERGEEGIEFNDEADAIEYAFEATASDDEPTGIMNEGTGEFTAIVFRGRVWRPQRDADDSGIVKLTISAEKMAADTVLAQWPDNTRPEGE